MLPANVMSFVKKMVANQPEPNTSGSITPEDSGTAFSKLKQFGSGLMMATGNVTKLAPPKVTPVDDEQPKEDPALINNSKPKQEVAVKTNSRHDECRVCRKSFMEGEVSRVCFECQHKVCEDCASYSTAADSDDLSTWRCSVCRRKIASRDQPIVTQESTDSLLEVPVLEALHRRHSEARLGCQSGSQLGSFGSGLAPPRSPELRRHSDVSPASFKELEKFRKGAAERRDDLKWEKELERKSKSRGGSPDRHQPDKVRAISPQRTAKPPQPTATEQDPATEDIDEEEDHRRRMRRTAGTIRRKSRVTRQRSYDDEIKNLAPATGGTSQTPHTDTGLGLPVQLPRRASAYDVYAIPGASGLNVGPATAVQPRGSISVAGGREIDERSGGRRPSFRAGKPKIPYEIGTDDKKIINLEMASGSVVTPTALVQPVLVPDEERRIKRKGSQLPDINAIRALTASPGTTKPTPPAQSATITRVAADERSELPRQGSLVDGEGIKIVIHDVDSDMVPRLNATKRRVKLRRDSTLDKGHRPRGFGMRVIGGKTGADGRTFASIVWTVPGGPAEKAGLQQGDKVLEWSGVSLIDRSFEEVAQIIDRTDEVAELVVEHSTDVAGDPLDDSGSTSCSGKTPTNLGLLLEYIWNNALQKRKRRKHLHRRHAGNYQRRRMLDSVHLAQSTQYRISEHGLHDYHKMEQIAKERQVTGRIQIQISYEADRKELVVSVFTADDLCAREDNGYGVLPEAYAKLLLVPPCAEQPILKTAIAEPTQKPIWNATLFFSGVDGESLMERAIEVTLWDYCPDGDSVFLGECTVDLQKALENDRAVWYRLEDPRSLRSGKSPYCSPRGSLPMEIAQRLLRKPDLRDRSYSDDTQSDSGSPELYFLHPDHAWHANSRRGSSQSEQLEIEPYELNRDYSRSLPGSRRSSFQSQVAGGSDSKRASMGEADIAPIIHYNRDRRRSSFTRPTRDPEEILEGFRSLKATKGELNRTMSLTSDKRRGSRRGERKESIMDIPNRFFERNSESDEDESWNNALKNEKEIKRKLGRGQVPPKGLNTFNGTWNGEIKLGFCLSKGTLEVEVITAKDICPGEKDEPDTYVKTYLRDGDRWLQKRKTRVIRHSRNPQYRQTIKYGSCDALGRNLLVMLWEKKQGFESNQGLGGAEVNIDLLPFSRLTVDWYPLFPIHTLGTQTADSP